MDGSGYPSGLRADGLPMGARVIAAADVYHALLEPRPHRAAMEPDTARQVFAAEVTEGRLDGDAVRAVLDAAGHLAGGPAGHAVAGGLPRAGWQKILEDTGFVDVRIGPSADTFGGAPGEEKARVFEVYGSAFLARRP